MAMRKILSVFSEYLQPGGEAEGIAQICSTIAEIAEVKECRFSSADWVGSRAPNVVSQALRMVRNPESLTKLREMQSNFAPNVWLVHNVFPVGSAAIYPEAERLGVPIIQYLHNFRPFSVNGYLWAGGKVAAGGLQGSFWEETRHGAWQGSRLKTAWFAFVLKYLRFRGWPSVRAWIAISEFVRQN